MTKKKTESSEAVPPKQKPLTQEQLAEMLQQAALHAAQQATENERRRVLSILATEDVYAKENDEALIHRVTSHVVGGCLAPKDMGKLFSEVLVKLTTAVPTGDQLVEQVANS